MSDGEVNLSMAIPVDSDGFLRRECPTCEREFKWLPTSSDDEDAAGGADGGYFCPYCGVQAPADAWFTKPQIELAQHIAEAEVEPMLRKFADDIGRSFRSAGMTIRNTPASRAEEPGPLAEDDDMTRVDFVCHPSEPLKVLDGWHQPVHCRICGEVNA